MSDNNDAAETAAAQALQKKQQESQANFVAEQYVLDAQDVKKAYEKKPESLSVLFNAMNKAKTSRWVSGLVGTLTSLAFVRELPPEGIAGAFLTLGLVAYFNNRVEKVGKKVKDEVNEYHAAAKTEQKPKPKDMEP